MSDSAEKNHEPSERKRQDAKARGEVAQSRDVTAVASIAGGVLALAAIAGSCWSAFALMLRTHLSHDHLPERVELVGILAKAMGDGISEVWPVLLAGPLLALFAGFLQVGPLFSTESLAIKPERLNPVTRLKDMLFSLNALVNLLKGSLKFGLVLTMLGIILLEAAESLGAVVLGQRSIGLFISSNVDRLAVWIVAGSTILAGADLLFQRYRHTHKLKMSDEEVKREVKDDEGDPLVRAQRKAQIQNMIASGRVSDAKRATVVVTNPTHLACAVLFDSEHPVPTLLAKGAGLVAARMRRAAEVSGVPVRQDIALARALFRLPEHAEIPVELHWPMALTLRWVEDLHRARGNLPPWEDGTNAT